MDEKGEKALDSTIILKNNKIIRESKTAWIQIEFPPSPFKRSKLSIEFTITPFQTLEWLINGLRSKT